MNVMKIVSCITFGIVCLSFFSCNDVTDNTKKEEVASATATIGGQENVQDDESQKNTYVTADAARSLKSGKTCYGRLLGALQSKKKEYYPNINLSLGQYDSFSGSELSIL